MINRTFFLLIAIIPAWLSAQSFNKARLDSFFDLLEAKQKAMGTVALAKNGKVIYKRSVGYCEITGDTKKPCSDLTRYRIGSITKMFTAAMIFQLAEKKKLSLDDNLSKYYPTVPNASRIKIRHLLNHHSGIHNFTEDSSYVKWLDKPKSKDELVALISKYPPDVEPGTKGAYSNSNYVLLGYILEKVTGKSYAENLKSRITSPLGLTSTYYGGKTNVANYESYSYRFSGKWEKDTETDMSIPGGAGAVVSTPLELTRFIEALFQGKLISSESLQTMTKLEGRFGMGVFQYPFDTKKAFGHTGGIDGFHNMVAYFPSDSLSIAYSSNGEVYDMNQILIAVLDTYFGDTIQMPEFKNYTHKPGELKKYTGVYASKAIPLKITVTENTNSLIAQATGQPAFLLEATSEHNFKFDAARLTMEFDPEKKEMTLKQGGGVYLFTKE